MSRRQTRSYKNAIQMANAIFDLSPADASQPVMLMLKDIFEAAFSMQVSNDQAWQNASPWANNIRQELLAVDMEIVGVCNKVFEDAEYRVPNPNEDEPNAPATVVVKHRFVELRKRNNRIVAPDVLPEGDDGTVYRKGNLTPIKSLRGRFLPVPTDLKGEYTPKGRDETVSVELGEAQLTAMYRQCLAGRSNQTAGFAVFLPGAKNSSLLQAFLERGARRASTVNNNVRAMQDRALSHQMLQSPVVSDRDLLGREG